MQLELITFEYEDHSKIRTVEIDGQIWFVGPDVCKSLEIANPSGAYVRLESDDLGTTEVIDRVGRHQQVRIISEYGLYDLIMLSRKPEARKFKRWVIHDVIPSIRKTGGYGKTSPSHAFVRRFNDNWDRVDQGYFSVISELYIRVYGKLEQVGYVVPERSARGKEIRPDVSVGQLFPKWLDLHYPLLGAKRRPYKHLINGMEVDAWQYQNEVLPAFIQYVETEWLKNRSYSYFRERDERALDYLPKLLTVQKPASGNVKKGSRQPAKTTIS